MTNPDMEFGMFKVLDTDTVMEATKSICDETKGEMETAADNSEKVKLEKVFNIE